MSNSNLVDYTLRSPNHSGKRNHTIDRITPHCYVGQVTVERIGSGFAAKGKSSCNYGIGTDGKVALIVDEENRSWCSSNSANDNRAVTIECASDSTSPYTFNDKVYNKLIDLCVDICQRNGKKKLLWIDNKTKALAYSPKSDEMLLTVHRWFAKKECPGNWMYSRMGDLAKKVTDKLNPQIIETPVNNSSYPSVPFTVTVLIPDLNIRKSPNGDITGKVTGEGTFTISKIEGDWGYLKSGLGYIYLKNEKYVKINKTSTSNNSYVVQVIVNSLYYREGPGTQYKINGVITDRGRYTITEEKEGWGKLSSGAGWIKLSYTKKI